MMLSLLPSFVAPGLPCFSCPILCFKDMILFIHQREQCITYSSIPLPTESIHSMFFCSTGKQTLHNDACCLQFRFHWATCWPSPCYPSFSFYLVPLSITWASAPIYNDFLKLHFPVMAPWLLSQLHTILVATHTAAATAWLPHRSTVTKTSNNYPPIDAIVLFQVLICGCLSTPFPFIMDYSTCFCKSQQPCCLWGKWMNFFSAYFNDLLDFHAISFLVQWNVLMQTKT